MAALNLTDEYIIKKIDELPTLPTIIYELSRVINDPMSSTSEVEKIMANDMSITTKVLKLANSAYYAIPGGVSSLSRAIAYLGFDTVNQLVLSSSIIKALEIDPPSKFDINQFWTHSIGVGIASEVIAKEVKHPMPSDLFTSGLTHDIGKVAQYTIDAESMVRIAELAIEKNMTYADSESELSLPTHTKIGGLLAEKWQLPQEIVVAIKFHHQLDPNKRMGISAKLSQVVDIVYLANLLIHALQFGHSGHSVRTGAPKELMERLNIDPGDGFKKLLINIKNSLGQAEEFIKVIGS
ncbi:MAG: HDOD domain-containing protein [Bdellovibrionales bacterium]|nr:HDOD domain-containing protein [Bdellovibrionales bacterium]